ncbi:S41 family peptidase [Mycoplasma sp. HS2188]|uniref:S41 family peptidase n=1 Tax=Mycoplasma sp. HS2188 TaxID=2976765 RepID=UPI0021A9DC3A|nr:S41 family peptidase [Mycoplasma sp. HS2188]MCT4469514.1 S41 family peptidase [Mycoplasma sp. HS2188]
MKRLKKINLVMSLSAIGSIPFLGASCLQGIVSPKSNGDKNNDVPTNNTNQDANDKPQRVDNVNNNIAEQNVSDNIEETSHQDTNAKNGNTKTANSRSKRSTQPPAPIYVYTDETIRSRLINNGEKEFRDLDSQSNPKILFDTYSHISTGDDYINVNDFVNRIIANNNTNYFKIEAQDSKNITFKINNTNRLIFDEEYDTVTFDSQNAFEIAPFNGNSFGDDSIKYEGIETHKTKPSTTIDLSKYNVDVIVDNGNVYLPVSVFNLMFLSGSYYNVYYNNDRFVGASYNTSRSNPGLLYSFYTSSNTHEPTVQSRINNYNYLRLLFDHYYGLAKRFYQKNNVNNFDEFSIKTNLKQKLLSTNVNVYKGAYEKLWYKYLDDLHSRLISKSYYDIYDGQIADYFNFDGRELSAKSNKHAVKKDELVSYREKSITRDRNGIYNLNNKITHVHGDTARIVLDEFVSATEKQKRLPDAWRFDTYLKMRAALNRIKSDDPHGKVKNIILDISLNGGGSTDALQKVLGFLSNQTLNLFIQNRQTGEYKELSYKVDTNGDGVVDSRDGFTNYKWYILVGINTFSAANLLTHAAKEMKIATIIGQKSGGGMFSVFPTVLPDGTNVDISSVNGWTGGTNKSIKSIKDLPYTEDGVDVDYFVNYENFADHDILHKLIKNNQ